MKKLTTILLILVLATTLNAQNQTFTEMIDSIFQHVSRVDATTGILYNRVLPFSNIKQFSGCNPDTANMYQFLHGYSELYNAAHNQK